MNWFLLLTQAFISAGGVLLLRASLPDLSNSGVSLGNIVLPSIGAILYLSSFIIWLYILSRNSVSVAYPISIGATLGFVAIGASVFLGERVSFLQIVGMMLLLSGIFLISWNYRAAV